MKLHLCISRIFVAVLALLLSAKLATGSNSTKVMEEMNRLHELDLALSKGGISEMLETASQKGISAPKINSKYYAGRIGMKEPALVQLEQAKRAFGLKVAQALDEIAAEIQHPNTKEVRAAQAKQLLDVAEWFKAEKGYGNYILVIRCENLAAVPLAYLVADLDFPLEKITALRNRIMPRSEQREFRKVVLNSEAPKPFIGTLTGTESEQDEQMQIAWAKGWHAMSDWFQARNVNIDHWKRSDLPEDLAFFLDESPTGPKTTVESWDMDRHVGIAINGLRDKNVDNITGFARYRELVGKFPTEPPKWWKPDDKLHTAREAAFLEAWKPFFKNNDPSCGEAMIVYEQVSSGKFMDGESQLKKQAPK